jgi:hypothetical protein
VGNHRENSEGNEEMIQKELSFYFYWMWVLTWRSKRGRYFIFRDAPDYIVVMSAGLKNERYGKLSYSVQNIIDQAGDELTARIGNIKRELDTAIQKAEENK